MNGERRGTFSLSFACRSLVIASRVPLDTCACANIKSCRECKHVKVEFASLSTCHSVRRACHLLDCKRKRVTSSSLRFIFVYDQDVVVTASLR